MNEEFYGTVFGWKAHTSGMPTDEYTSFMLADRPVSRMMAIRPEWGPVPPNWSIYPAVEDCDAAIDKATALCGTTTMEPMGVPTPGAGRIALLQNSRGAMFFVMSTPDDGS